MKLRRLAGFAAAAFVAGGVALSAVADLPAGYTQVPYLKLNGQCRVKTGLTPTGTDIVEMSWRPMTVSGNQNLWCSRVSGTQQFTVFMIANKIRFDRNGGQVTSNETITAATDYTIVANYGTLAGSVTETATGAAVTSVTMSEGDYTPGSELCIFASHDASVDAGLNNYGSYRFYSFKLKAADGTVKCDLVPAKRDADGMLGVYDVARSVFLENDLTGVFTTSEMTITSSSPQWGKAITVGDGETLTIEAGDSSPSWTGAVTVDANGVLKTSGKLRFIGAVVVNASGTLDVLDGVTEANIANRKMSGTLIVRQPARVKFTTGDCLNYDGTFNVHVYGTLDVQNVRQSINAASRLYLYDGSRVVGIGDGTNGGIDFYQDDTRMVAQGEVTLETPFRSRTAGHNLKVACFEGAHVKFLRGFSATAGNVVQEAATVEEGNESGTCANAVIEVSANPVAQSSPTGKFTFISKAAMELKGAAQTFSVETSGAEFEVRASSQVAAANSAAVQTLPAITTSTATVRLTGDGTVALQDAAPAFPISFEGPALQIASGAPVALAAGSAVAASTLVGVDGLAANTAATIFTGADASFDVSKISVSAMHNGAAMGESVAASLADGSVTIAGVPAYAADAWVVPYLRKSALMWLDASDAANFTFKDGSFGQVAAWRDSAVGGRDAVAYVIPQNAPAWGTYGVAAGVPAFLMGDCGSGVDLQYTRMTTIRTVFWVMSIRQDLKAFWLGDTSTYRFHRGNSGAYCYNNGNAYLREGPIYCDGVEVTGDKYTVKVPTDRHVYSTVTTKNCESNRLTSDRDCDTYTRHAGRELSELIVLPDALSDADRQAIEAYLAAKWMGSNPTAAATEGTYKFTGDMKIEGEVGGDKNLVFADGASISISRPTGEGAMLKTTGTVTLPAGSALPVTVDTRTLQPGTYTVIDAAGGITSLDQFAAAAETLPGYTATFAVSDGKLIVTLAASGAVPVQTWRPQSSSDLGWNATSANWLIEGGATSGFIPYVTALFDGDDATTGDIVVEGALQAGPVNVTGAKDYTFAGDGTLQGSSPVTLGGTGTVTLDGPSLDGQNVVIKDGQKVVLGDNASEDTFGADSGSGGGKVTIENGGQLNIRYTPVVSSTTDPRQEITHHKTFVISGEGPDGRGAIVNDVGDGRGTTQPYGSQFRRIELAGDATIGGPDRFEVRLRDGTKGTATPGVYGPEKRLTIKMTNQYGFGLIGQPIDVGAVTVAEGATFRPENVPEKSISIPGGIKLDGGIIHGYGTSYPATVPLYVTANGGAVDAQSGTGTFKGPVNLAEGATLTLKGGSTVNYNGGVNGAGTISATAGTHNFSGEFDGPSFTVTGGNTYLANGFDAKTDIEVAHSAGGFFLKEGSKAKTINVTHTGGSFGFMPGSGTGPQFEEINITSTGGAIDIRPQATGMMDVQGVVNVNQSAGTTYVYGPGNNAEYGLALTMIGSIAQLNLGNSVSYAGDLRLKEGSDLTVKNLHLSTNGSSGNGPAHGRIVIDPGAKLAVNGEFHMGRWSQNPAVVSVHTVDVGGEVDASGIVTYAAYDSPRSVLYIREGGVFKTQGIWLNHLEHRWGYGSGVGAAEGRHWLVMEGGRFEMGSSGFNGMWTPGVTKIDIQNGDFVNVNGAWGGNHGAPIFFGYEKLGGKVTFDMAGYFVNWNTGLSGASDLTIKGSVNFQGGRPIDCLQGAYIGSITVENTGGNDFRNVSCFSGGLKLADGVNVQVAKYSDSRYAYAVAGAMNSGNTAKDYSDNIAATGWSYPFISADFFNYIHTHYSSNQRQTYTCTAGRGEFYVPEEKAGIWTFAGNYDDTIRFDVDGAQVFKSASWTAAGRGTVELAAGWHKFTITAYDATGGVGPGQATWTNGKALGFFVGETSSTTAGDYVKFEPDAPLGDGLALQVRPCANVCVWSWQNGNGNWDTTENWSHIKCLDTVAPMHKHSSAADANDWSSYFSGKANKFEGWFKVENDQKGEWKFNMGYDDRKMLVVDGEELIKHETWNAVATGKKELDPGWHRWEVRVQDGSGGWGPGSVNGGNALSFVLPGSTENRQWNETNLKLAATLGDIAVLEPTGIYKDLELGEGATLTSSGTMAMPIFGTLKGTGALAGAFAFAGDVNCWEVKGVYNRRTLAKAAFTAPTGATFEGLKEVKAKFDRSPVCSVYYLTDEAVSGISSVDLSDVRVTVTAGEKDYSEKFSLGVSEGRLVLSNRVPGGAVLYIR